MLAPAAGDTAGTGVPIALESPAQLQALIGSAMLLVLFGSPQCGICEAIKPRLADLVRGYPGMIFAYADCAHAPHVCAQYGVFTLPAVKVYVAGQLTVEMARSFSLRELGARIDRVSRLRDGHA